MPQTRSQNKPAASGNKKKEGSKTHQSSPRCQETKMQEKNNQSDVFKKPPVKSPSSQKKRIPPRRSRSPAARRPSTPMSLSSDSSTSSVMDFKGMTTEWWKLLGESTFNYPQEETESYANQQNSSSRSSENHGILPKFRPSLLKDQMSLEVADPLSVSRRLTFDVSSIEEGNLSVVCANNLKTNRRKTVNPQVFQHAFENENSGTFSSKNASYVSNTKIETSNEGFENEDLSFKSVKNLRSRKNKQVNPDLFKHAFANEMSRQESSVGNKSEVSSHKLSDSDQCFNVGDSSVEQIRKLKLKKGKNINPELFKAAFESDGSRSNIASDSVASPQTRKLSSSIDAIEDGYPSPTKLRPKSRKSVNPEIFTSALGHEASKSLSPKDRPSLPAESSQSRNMSVSDTEEGALHAKLRSRSRKSINPEKFSSALQHEASKSLSPKDRPSLPAETPPSRNTTVSDAEEGKLHVKLRPKSRKSINSEKFSSALQHAATISLSPRNKASFPSEKLSVSHDTLEDDVFEEHGVNLKSKTRKKINPELFTSAIDNDECNSSLKDVPSISPGKVPAADEVLEDEAAPQKLEQRTRGRKAVNSETISPAYIRKDSPKGGTSVSSGKTPGADESSVGNLHTRTAVSSASLPKSRHLLTHMSTNLSGDPSVSIESESGKRTGNLKGKRRKVVNAEIFNSAFESGMSESTQSPMPASVPAEELAVSDDLLEDVEEPAEHVVNLQSQTGMEVNSELFKSAFKDETSRSTSRSATRVLPGKLSLSGELEDESAPAGIDNLKRKRRNMINWETFIRKSRSNSNNGHIASPANSSASGENSRQQQLPMNNEVFEADLQIEDNVHSDIGRPTNAENSKYLVENGAAVSERSPKGVSQVSSGKQSISADLSEDLSEVQAVNLKKRRKIVNPDIFSSAFQNDRSKSTPYPEDSESVSPTKLSLNEGPSGEDAPKLKPKRQKTVNAEIFEPALNNDTDSSYSSKDTHSPVPNKLLGSIGISNYKDPERSDLSNIRLQEEMHEAFDVIEALGHSGGDGGNRTEQVPAPPLPRPTKQMLAKRFLEHTEAGHVSRSFGRHAWNVLDKELLDCIKSVGKNLQVNFNKPSPWVRNFFHKQEPLKKKVKRVTKKKPDSRSLFTVDGKPYKPPRYRKLKWWTTKRLYNVIREACEKNNSYSAGRLAEEYFKKIVTAVDSVMKSKKNFDEQVKEVRSELIKIGLIQTQFDFYMFIENYLPYMFRIKSIPAVHALGDIYPHADKNIKLFGKLK